MNADLGFIAEATFCCLRAGDNALSLATEERRGRLPRATLGVLLLLLAAELGFFAPEEALGMGSEVLGLAAAFQGDMKANTCACVRAQGKAGKGGG